MLTRSEFLAPSSMDKLDGVALGSRGRASTERSPVIEGSATRALFCSPQSSAVFGALAHCADERSDTHITRHHQSCRLWKLEHFLKQSNMHASLFPASSGVLLRAKNTAPTTRRAMEGRPRRACTLAPADPHREGGVEAAVPDLPRRPRPTGRVLIIHANAKPYGTGPIGSTSDGTAAGTAAVKAKASNRNFNFSCADYEAMRDSGRPYSGDPRVNTLLPLPRPTYTEFINVRA